MRGRNTRQWGGLLLLAIITGVVALFAVGLGGAAAASSASSWKFAPTINAPWAQGDDDDVLDSPAPNLAAVCRSTLFNTVNPYAPTSNVDLINGDAVNNSGFSNRGC